MEKELIMENLHEHVEVENADIATRTDSAYRRGYLHGYLAAGEYSKNDDLLDWVDTRLSKWREDIHEGINPPPVQK
jgi:hypothetical protein